MYYPNKYFSAKFDNLFDNNTACYTDIVFLKDIGPYKVGDRFPSGYIVVLLDDGINKIIIEMNTELGAKVPTLRHEIDLFALT